jgi:aryl-alcohol dehydrogenase-like predicted oxidoreductase
MNSRRLGKTGLSVSEIGMGTMTFGSFADESTSHAILDRAFDAGIDFLDVAEMYPVPPRADTAGRSEEICGKWMAGKPRDSIILATKVAGPGGGWFLGPMRSGHTALDRFNIETAVDDSLRRLGTDYIDLYQTHWPDGDYPIEDTLEALDRVVEAGKVRYVGCSNQSAYGLTRSLWMADRHTSVRYETIQNNYSLINRRFDDELAEVCRKEKVSLLAYSPLAAGVLTGKYDGGAFPEGARFSLYGKDPARGAMMTKRFINERSLEATRRLSEIASDCNLTPAAFAVAWTLSRDFVGSSLIGATSVEQLEDSLGAEGAVLPPDALAACDSIAREIPYPLG